MSWTTASTEFNDNQIQIRDSDIDGLTVRGDLPFVNWSQLDTSTIKIATIFSLYFSDHLLMEGLLHYIAPFRPSWSYTCWSFEPLLEYLSHQTPSLVFCKLW